MANELWEIVRADQVKAGDVVIAGSPDEYDEYEVRSVKRIEDEDGEAGFGFDHGGIYLDYYSEDENLFRRVDSADDPMVLRRALEIASSQLLEAMHAMMERKSPKPSVNDVKHYIDNCISRAVSELESEVRDATG